MRNPAPKGPCRTQRRKELLAQAQNYIAYQFGSFLSSGGHNQWPGIAPGRRGRRDMARKRAKAMWKGTVPRG